MSYKQIHVSIWKDEWVLDLSPEEKLLFIYLFSNENSSIAGIYKLALKVISFETGLDLSFIDISLRKFWEAEKSYFENIIVWVRNLRKYNANNSPLVIKRLEAELREVPECQLKQDYISYMTGNIPYPYHINRIFG